MILAKCLKSYLERKTTCMEGNMSKVEITGVNTQELKTIGYKETNDLLKQVKEGSSEAREKLICYNLKLVLSVLKKFNNRKEHMDDLFQIGCIGLMKAIDNFDDSHNVRFSTYAVPMIIGEIRRYLRDNSLVKVSRSLKDIAYKTLQIKERYINEFHKEPTTKEIAKELDIEEIDVILALDAIQDPISIYTPVYNSGTDVINLIDQLEDKNDTYEKYSKEKLIKEGLKKLDKRDKEIIYERYFLNKTQTEIAEEIGISQAQVSRLEKTALQKLKDEIKVE